MASITIVLNVGSYSALMMLINFFSSTPVIDCEKYVEKLPAVSNFEICTESQVENFIIFDNKQIDLTFKLLNVIIIIDIYYLKL